MVVLSSCKMWYYSNWQTKDITQTGVNKRFKHYIMTEILSCILNTRTAIKVRVGWLFYYPWCCSSCNCLLCNRILITWNLFKIALLISNYLQLFFNCFTCYVFIYKVHLCWNKSCFLHTVIHTQWYLQLNWMKN